LIVADASLIVALILREDNVADPGTIYDLLRTTQLTVPAHWSAEVANALWANTRRGRITAEMVSAAAEYLVVFKPRIDAAPSIDRLPALIEFAERERLTVYDAIYVQLALSHNASLATIDSDVRASAKRLDIPLLPA
jgi:predicted nucleic acid-binding protein